MDWAGTGAGAFGGGAAGVVDPGAWGEDVNGAGDCGDASSASAMSDIPQTTARNAAVATRISLFGIRGLLHLDVRSNRTPGSKAI